MKKIITLFLCVCAVNITFAQVTFQKSYGYEFYPTKWAVAQVNGGGYIVGGATDSAGAGGLDALVTRTDDSGNIVWSKTYGGSNADVANVVRPTNDGGFIIAGSTNSYGKGGYDMYLIKTDENGDTLWTRTYGDTIYDEDAWAIDVTDDDGFMIVGDWGSSGYNYLVRTDSVGDTLWTKVYDSGKCFGLSRTDHHGYILANTVYVNATGQDMGLEKIDSLGNVIWCKSYGSLYTEYAFKAINANDGGYIEVGSTQGFGQGGKDIYVVKTDTSGKLQWSKTYGTPNSDQAFDIVSTGNGYTILGSTVLSYYTGALLLNIDDTGKVSWLKEYPQTNMGCTMLRTGDGGYLFGSSYQTNFLIKTDSLGNTTCNDTALTLTFITATAPTIVDSTVPNLLHGTVICKTQSAINNYGTATTLCIYSGIDELKNNNVEALSVLPNPCAECELTGALNANDLVVMDILGRKITAGFIKTATGYDVQLPQSANGLYFITDLKTGSAVKFIKE